MHVINAFYEFKLYKAYVNNLRYHTDLCVYTGLVGYDMHILTCKGFRYQTQINTASCKCILKLFFKWHLSSLFFRHGHDH
jgi:hypothetical protein